MNTELKRLLNSLKCPICKAQIDTNGKSAYCCANNYTHYTVSIEEDWTYVPKIALEVVSIFDDSHEYRLIKDHSINGVITTIKIYDCDPEGRVSFSFKENKIVMEKDLFDFANFDVKKALNRIKTILVFS